MIIWVIYIIEICLTKGQNQKCLANKTSDKIEKLSRNSQIKFSKDVELKQCYVHEARQLHMVFVVCLLGEPHVASFLIQSYSDWNKLFSMCIWTFAVPCATTSVFMAFQKLILHLVKPRTISVIWVSQKRTLHWIFTMHHCYTVPSEVCAHILFYHWISWLMWHAKTVVLVLLIKFYIRMWY